MQNVMSLWMQMDLRRRVIIVGATVAMFAAILALSRMAGTPSMALLYSGLDSAAAGEVVATLQQDGVAYQVTGDSIYVEAGARDALRMTLATQGLPRGGATGYELLDGLSGFGTTSQMFDAAYWRAKEGELARTILANPQIRTARVHLAQLPDRAFRRDEVPTASVTVTTLSGSLPDAQARALRHLVAGAVSGMLPGNVQVIDSVGGLIAAEGNGAEDGAVAEDRAATIRGNVERLLAARVGPGKAVVEVTVDLVTEREAITERTFDPQGRVVISSETQERTGSSTEPGGDVTVASNLPDGDAEAGAAGQSQNAETTERVNYEVSETEREVLRSPGSIKRLSVAVLVDGQMLAAADGTQTWQARPEEELVILRELVASAVGLDEDRGDMLTVRTLQFESPPALGTTAEAGMLSAFGTMDMMPMVQSAVLALVAIVLGLFVVRPILLAPARVGPLAGSPGPLALPGPANGDAVLTGEIDDGLDLLPMAMMSGFDDGPADSGQEDPVARLRRLIEERQAESVEILRGWMEPEEELR